MYLYYYNITASLEDELEPVLLSLGLFSAKPYIHKQNRNEISVHFLVKVSHQENMCCLDFTCIRLFYVFWPAFEHYQWLQLFLLVIFPLTIKGKQLHFLISFADVSQTNLPWVCLSLRLTSSSSVPKHTTRNVKTY